MLKKFDLVIISPPNDLPGESGYVTKLFELGLQYYHLRKPLWQLRQADEFLHAIPAIYHPRIVVHSNFSLTKLYPLKGIHLNSDAQKNATLLNTHKVVSASFHSFEEMRIEKFNYEYVFLSPVFNSISKSGYKGVFDLKLLAEQIKDWRKQNPDIPKIIALAGVDANNIKILNDIGFSGAAVIGAVWNNDPITAFKALQRSVVI